MGQHGKSLYTKSGFTWMDLKTCSISLSWIYILDPFNHLEKWEILKYMWFARSQLQVMMPLCQCFMWNWYYFKDITWEDKIHSISTNYGISTFTFNTIFKGCRIKFCWSKELYVDGSYTSYIAPRVRRSYNTRNTPKTNENG